MDEVESFCTWHCPCRVLLAKKPYFSVTNVFDFSLKNQAPPSTTTAGAKRTTNSNLSDNNTHGRGVSGLDGGAEGCYTEARRSEEELDKDDEDGEEVAEREEHEEKSYAEAFDLRHPHPVASVSSRVEVKQSTLNKVVRRVGRPPGRRFLSATNQRTGQTLTQRPAQVITKDETTAAGYDSKSLENRTIEIQINPSEDLKSEATTPSAMEESHSEKDLATPKVTSKSKAPPSSAPAAVSSYSARVRNRSSFHKCSNCGKMFGQLSSLKWHEKEHLLESAKQCECVECGKSYTSLSSYQRHLKTHTKCLLCGKTISKASIKQSQYDTKGLAVNVCQKCRNADSSSYSPKTVNGNSKVGRGTASTQVMMEVSETTDAINGRDMKPSLDGNGELYIFEEDQTTGKEEREEVATKRFKCDICSKTFGLIRQLSQHYTIHLRSTPTPTYPCNYCTEVFTETKQRAKHESEAHPRERPYQCLRCPARFKAPHHLTRHKLSHTKEKPFKCDHCGQGFNQRFRLTRHLARVHNIHVKWNNNKSFNYSSSASASTPSPT